MANQRVNFESVHLGDTIMSVQHVGDTKIITVGVVAKRDSVRSRPATLLLSAAGEVIAAKWPSQSNPPVIFLLRVAAQAVTQQTLWDEETTSEIRLRVALEEAADAV